MALREHTPGLPDYFSGKRSIDPLPITRYNVDENLIGWMTTEELARALHIQTQQGVAVLFGFLTECKYATKDCGDTVLWSKFSGKVCGQ